MKKVFWSLMDDRRGSVGQALGIIGALNKDLFEVEEKNLEYNKFAGLPNFIRGRTLFGLTKQSAEQIKAPFPDYVLSISRRTVPVARYIKKMSPKTKLIQLMYSGKTGQNDFDLMVVPEHDRKKAKGKNIHYIVGCPHRITAEFLEKERAKWSEKFSSLPRPLTAVIVGGAIKNKPFSPQNALALGKALKELKAKIGGSILITTSRRTGEEAQKIIMEQIKDIPQHTFLWGDKSENPYGGYLACADNLVVTGDSVSMCCEATGPGKPLWVFCGKDWLTKKHLRFVNSLYASKCAVALEDKSAFDFKPQKTLNASTEIAKMIEKL